MYIFIHIITAILLLLILSNIYYYFKHYNIIENISNNSENNNYKNYDDLESKDPLFLATKNAANISYLKTRLDEINGLSQKIDDMGNSIDAHSSQLDEIQQSIADGANQLTGGGSDNEDLKYIANDDNEDVNEDVNQDLKYIANDDNANNEDVNEDNNEVDE